jgi:hypothetical protein
MKVQTGWRRQAVVRRALALGVCFLLFATQPGLGGAAVITQSFLRGNVSVAPPLVELYDYSGGTANTWTSTADFDTGTYTDANGTEVNGSITLDRIGPTGVAAPDPGVPWFDTDWTNRSCYQIDHTAAGATSVTQYPIRVSFPITTLVAGGYVQADYGDLRAIGADGSTSLPLWVDDTEPDTIWIQVDQITAGATSDVCVYFGYAPGTAGVPANHTEASVFTYSTPKDLYYTVSDVFTDPGADINVVSYADGNEVALDGTAAIALDAGDLTTFAAADATPESVISALAPVAAVGIGDGADTLVPISFAGTSFVAPISRDAQTFSFFAPFGDATVDLYDGATAIDTFTVPAGTAYTYSTTDITDGNAAIIESDVPVLATHRSATGGDAFPLYPATPGDFYAVRSTAVVVGYNTDDTNLQTTASDGAVAGATGTRGGTTVVVGGGEQGGGSGDGIHLTADQPVGVIEFDDGDGTDSSVVLPASELDSEYWIPTNSQYVAFACPTSESADVPLTITPPGAPSRASTCTGGPDVAWATDTADLDVTTDRGIAVVADEGTPFAAYYEDRATDDQIGMLGWKQGRQYTWPEPVVTPGDEEGIYTSTGSWESATVDVGVGNEVYGMVDLAGETPTGTTLGVQIATAASGTPSDFVGPDGTASSFFTLDSLPAVADFSHDGDRLLRVRVELTTEDPAQASPRLGSVSVDSGLPELGASLGSVPTIALTTTLDPDVTTSYLLRVKTANPDITGSDTTAVYRDAENPANLAEETIRFVNDALGVDSIQQSATLPTDPPLLFQEDRPYSVVLDHSAVASGIVTTLVFAWQLDYQGGGSIYAERDFAVQVTAP